MGCPALKYEEDEIYSLSNSSATETLAYAFFYNGDGDLYELRNYRTNRVSLYEYDHTGRCMACTERSFTVSGSTFTYGSVLSRYRYQYDLADNLTKLSCYALGNSWDTTYTYDIPNRLYKTKLSSNVEVHNKLSRGRFS